MRSGVWARTAFALAILLSAGASAQDAAPAPPSQAALNFVDSSGQSEQFVHLTNMMIPVVIAGVRDRRPAWGEACWTTLETGMRKSILAHQEDVRRDTARAYAAHFSDDELTQLAQFYASELGRKYRAALIVLIGKAVSQPGAAKPFVSQLTRMLSGTDPVTSEQHLASVFAELKGSLTESEISQLSSFFYNGVGRKFIETNPQALADMAKADAVMLAGDIAGLREQLRQSGECP